MSVKSEVSNWKYSTFLENKNYKFSRNDILNILTEEDIDEAYKIISDWENYAPTPLLLLDKLSTELKLKRIFIKMSQKDFILNHSKLLVVHMLWKKLPREIKKL